MPVKLQNKKTNFKTKVALGMSGGVDSSTCAHLLIEQGYDVTGVFLECWKAPGCRSEEDRKDALKIALDLGIPFKILDFKKAYKDKVVEYFFEEYKKGLTPNPDVMCNKEIKFGLFYNWAMDNKFDFIATGHYAKIAKTTYFLKPNLKPTSKNNAIVTKKLFIPKDAHKDQTYFLYLMNQDQIDHTIFPLQDLNKSEVRKIAQLKNIHVSNKKDSVGICFIGDINVHEFLKDRLGENPGDVVDTAGNVIGSHRGLWFYTIGQRSGFTIKSKVLIKQDDGSTISKHNIPPFYVIKKKPKQNQLVVGFGFETLSDEFKVRDIHWINDDNEELAYKKSELYVRIRHTGELLKCKLNNNVVKLDQSIKGIAEGQSAVFYLCPRGYQQISKNIEVGSGSEIICLGGGIIS
ncbi:MAG: tRNA 2-thiouridine(34) synthase MnmA [Pseudomonadales bacterium]|nr:tRNA 2-thiouridine(34) synthase MnmA [Pseudomonadales bacterium]